MKCEMSVCYGRVGSEGVCGNIAVIRDINESILRRKAFIFIPVFTLLYIWF